MSKCKVCDGYGYVSGAMVPFPSPDEAAEGGIVACPACTDVPKLFATGQPRVFWRCPACGEEQSNRHYGKLQCVCCLDVVGVTPAGDSDIRWSFAATLPGCPKP